MDNAEDLINLFIIGGHISNTIPYDKIQNYFIDNINYNNDDGYGISLQLFGIVIGELCRSTKDVSKPFRLTGSTNMHDYKSISIIDIDWCDSTEFQNEDLYSCMYFFYIIK